ncbi:MAG: alpha-L-arabinofuranosidase C-terminal domain-containing protein [Candidatus Bathyarchaeia archaeon]|nr:alpha-N-arabinofuranosidase [Candidatus Bathyarchaeota archaeon]
MRDECKIFVNFDAIIERIDPKIYGHFIEHLGQCIYDGIWVGENSGIPNINGLRKDVIDALLHIKAPIIRWPGGCFADTYHWEDGIGPRERRPVKRNLWWGGEERNLFGTDEYIMLCKKVKAEPYICLNVGSGSVQEAIYWLEYCNYSGKTAYAELRRKNGHPEPYYVKYWEIGNESWACGGSFTPEYYAWEYRRFATYLKAADPSIYLVACGRLNIRWMTTLMEYLSETRRLIDGIAIHYYFSSRRKPFGKSVEFSDEEYYNIIYDVQNLEYFIRQTADIINKFTRGSNLDIVIDEWGAWYSDATHKTGLFQQNTIRDGILAGIVLNLYNRYSNVIRIANLAQTVNVLQSLFLTKNRLTIMTPTYYVFDIYKHHMGNYSLMSKVSSPLIKEEPTKEMIEAFSKEKGKVDPLAAIDSSISLDKENRRIVVTLVNVSLDDDIEVRLDINGVNMSSGELILVTSKNVRDHNDFENPKRIVPKKEDISIKGEKVNFTIPKHSIGGLLLHF